MSDKIREHHLQRKAILYVRQSSQYQVLHNEESQKLQYAMESRVKHLGWTHVDVIDEDLGKSASGSTNRIGFERLIAEVCLGQVGAVAAREVSRFARNSREWQQLIEVCRMVDTVLIDQETVYDPRRGNDRLLVVSRNEAEAQPRPRAGLRVDSARESRPPSDERNRPGSREPGSSRASIPTIQFSPLLRLRGGST